MEPASEQPLTAERPGGVWAVMRRELHIIAHSPFYLLFTFILPLVSFGVLGAIFYHEIPRDMPVIVCDKDDSKLSRQLIRMIDAASALSVAAQVGDIEEGAGIMRQGRAYAIFFIPPNLEHDVKRGQAPAITLYFNNQWMPASGMITRSAREVIGTLSAGLDIRSRMMKGEGPSEALQKYEPIRLDQHPLFNPNLNYRYYLLPAVLPNIIMAFLIMVTVRAIGGELKHGTAREWLAAAGGSPGRALLGKLLPYGVCFIVLTNFMLALMVRFFNVPMYGSAGVLFLAGVLFVLAYQSMGLTLVALCANLRLATSMAGFYTGPALAFAGITYPFIGMPLPGKIWSMCLPLTYYLYILLQQALRGAPPQASARSLLALALFACIPPLLFTRRMGRLMRDPQYWGRL